eukprot:6179969-Pleurochrysis_carterae.AAC.1
MLQASLLPLQQQAAHLPPLWTICSGIWHYQRSITSILTFLRAGKRDHTALLQALRLVGQRDFLFLAKMARQHLGRPATSAGVERMFSKAGKMHDDYVQVAS